MCQLNAVLFAGGKSSRMGQNKALLPLFETSMAEFQYHKLQKSFKEVFISTKDTQPFKPFCSHFIDESNYKDLYAPTVGLLSSLKQLDEEGFIFVLAVDTPFVNKTVFDALCHSSFSDYDAVVVKTPTGVHPLCGIYSQAAKPILEAMIEQNQHKLFLLLDQLNVHYVEIDDETLLINLNTPEEYERALAHINKT